MPDIHGRMTADERAALIRQPITFRVVAPSTFGASRGPVSRSAATTADVVTYQAREQSRELR